MVERMSEVRHDGLVFPVRTAGPDDGEAVVFLHGFPQSSAAWSLHLDRLSEAGYRAVAPALRGYAATARPAGVDRYALDLLVGDVLGIADGLGIDRFHLVGHDWGGLIGWAVAAAHPNRLHTLTSVSTPHPRAFARSLYRSFQLGRSWYMGFFQLPLVPDRLLTAGHGALLRRSLRDSGLPHADADAYADAMLEPGAMTAALSYYRALRPGRTLAVGRICVPTLLVWGTHDVALGPVGARDTGSEVDAAYRFEVLEGASHWIPETRGDELAGLVLDHVRTAASSPAA